MKRRNFLEKIIAITGVAAVAPQLINSPKPEPIITYAEAQMMEEHKLQREKHMFECYCDPVLGRCVPAKFVRNYKNP